MFFERMENRSCSMGQSARLRMCHVRRYRKEVAFFGYEFLAFTAQNVAEEFDYLGIGRRSAAVVDIKAYRSGQRIGQVDDILLCWLDEWTSIFYRKRDKFYVRISVPGPG